MFLDYFREISAVPRGSHHNTKISNYLVEFAKKNNLKYIQDDHENVIIFKDASKGYENCKPLIIQGHMDMVCEKTADSDHDFENEGLELVNDGTYLYAKDTTLGADDGIAIAYMLELLSDDSIIHPPLEMVITSDEEIGMIGAQYFDASVLRGKHMINIDSEDEGIFIAGCAGGITAKTIMPISRIKKTGKHVTVSISGLLGGHSGADIDKNRTNANILMGRILLESISGFDNNAALISIAGGGKDNVIPNSCTAELLVETECYDGFVRKITSLGETIREELLSSEPGLEIVVEVENEREADVFDGDSFAKLIHYLNFVPNGIRIMSSDIEGVVESSLNLGILSCKEQDTEIMVESLLRSQKSSYIEYMTEALSELALSCGGICKASGDYPGYDIRRYSEFRDIMCKAYESVSGNKPVVTSIHAGLELGVFSRKIPDLDVISIGPDVHDIHTVKEKLDIESGKRTWEFIKKAVSDFAEWQKN